MINPEITLLLSPLRYRWNRPHHHPNTRQSPLPPCRRLVLLLQRQLLPRALPLALPLALSLALSLALALLGLAALGLGWGLGLKVIPQPRLRHEKLRNQAPEPCITRIVEGPYPARRHARNLAYRQKQTRYTYYQQLWDPVLALRPR